MEKEYGGYLPLEIPLLNYSYYDKYRENMVALNCGRSAIEYALKDASAKKIFLPYYNCPSVIETIKRLGIEFEYYYLDERLLPMDANCTDNDYILWVNYYGNATNDAKKEMTRMFNNVLFDNTQAFFSEPIPEHYNIYSCRKFFGVSDGAYLIKDKVRKLPIKQDISYEKTMHILKCIELGTNAVYEEHLQNEQTLADECLYMSKLTERILSSIDYERIKEKRNRNFEILHGILGNINSFPVNSQSNTHMVYPFVYKSEKLRNYLINQKIYVPTWWRDVPSLVNESSIESLLSRYLIPLPIDQRYDEEDMNYIANKVLEGLL